VVVDDFNVIGSILLPYKADAILIVNTDTVLTAPTSSQRFQHISRRLSKIVQTGRRIHPVELPSSYAFNAAPSPVCPHLSEFRRVVVFETPDHGRIIRCVAFNVKQPDTLGAYTHFVRAASWSFGAALEVTMSVTNFPGGLSSAAIGSGTTGSATTGISTTKVTMPMLAEMKRQAKAISALTAYDYSTARLADEAGIDLILVGDSLAMVVLGHENTLAVTVDEMLHHTRAVRRGVRRALLVADMPFGSYHGAVEEGVANAIRFVKEAGAEAVKIEGPRTELVRALSEAEIPVIGHLGLTPQSIHSMGGYRVQARTADAALQLKAEAHALAEAGAGALVLEGVPREVAAMITAELPIPTIGIGAGPECDGQILVFHDLVGLSFTPAAKFVRRYADAGALIRTAIEEYRNDVERRVFPSDEESYHLPETARRALANENTGALRKA
jgi:3-methyl-2-oxobutanoate hydroxymethyltransferase